jgi:hypothetical protein
MDIKELRPTNCIVCDKKLELDDCGPSGATVFYSHGNFGSTLFDPFQETISRSDTSTLLHAVVCDDCLKKKASFVVQKTHRQSLTITNPKLFSEVLKEKK